MRSFFVLGMNFLMKLGSLYCLLICCQSNFFFWRSISLNRFSSFFDLAISLFNTFQSSAVSCTTLCD
eukprot:UN06754